MDFAIVEAELELIPKELWKHRQVRAYAKLRGKKPSELLLEASYCHAAMKKIEDAERRGRPDIVHQALLLILDSPLNKRGELRIFVHTRDDVIIEISPETRLPRNYMRFLGLMEQLLKLGELPNGLMKAYEGSVDELFERLEKPIYIFDPEGELKKPDFWFSKSRGSFVFGGFPHGTYRKVKNKKRYSISEFELTAPMAIAMLLSWLEVRYSLKGGRGV